MSADVVAPVSGCSAMRIRRLLAGELSEADREEVQAHLDSCPRCQRTVEEVQREREALQRDVPFSAFAAGVAEKLASKRRAPRFAARTSGLAAAAAILIVAGVFVLRPGQESGLRSKGGAPAQIFVDDARGTRVLSAGEPISQGAKLRLAIHPGGRKYAAAVLLEPSESSVLYDGPAVDGALPEAFEWTGAAREARVLVVLSDEELDAKKLHDASDAPRGADVSELVLHR
jgi:hypothetical protein